MLSKTCTRILRPYGFEDVHAPLPAQYALNRSIRLDRKNSNGDTTSIKYHCPRRRNRGRLADRELSKGVPALRTSRNDRRAPSEAAGPEEPNCLRNNSGSASTSRQVRLNFWS